MSVPYIIHIQSCFFIGFKKTPILNFQVKTHRAVHFNGRDWARTLTLFVKQKPSKISHKRAQASNLNHRTQQQYGTYRRYHHTPPSVFLLVFSTASSSIKQEDSSCLLT
jgi:hypothetical protein